MTIAIPCPDPRRIGDNLYRACARVRANLLRLWLAFLAGAAPLDPAEAQTVDDAPEAQAAVAQAQPPLRPHICAMRVMAREEENQGQAGYRVVGDGGFSCWLPKEFFERAFFPLAMPDCICASDVDAFMAAGCTSSRELDKKADSDEITIFVQAEMPTGFTEYAATTCTDPERHDRQTAEAACLCSIHGKVWQHLRFVLNWGAYGLARRGRG